MSLTTRNEGANLTLSAEVIVESDSKVSKQSSVKKVLVTNTVWLFSEKMIRLILGLAVSVLMARILGPVDLGKWNYAESFFGMFIVFTTLGFDAIVVRDLVRNPEKRDELLGTAIVLKLIGTTLAIIISFLFISIIRPDDSVVRIINFFLATASLFQLFDVIDYWFRAQMLTKYIVIAKNIAFVAGSGLKIVLLVLKIPLVYIALCAHVEFIIGGLLLLYFYKRYKKNWLHWKFRLSLATSLLRNSWPIILSSSAIYVQARIDQVMIGEMLGDAAVGQYSVALRLIEVLGFIPVIISTVYAPLVTKAKLAGDEHYRNILSSVYRAMFIAFLISSIPLFFLSNTIVIVMYGAEFKEAGALLSLFAIRLFFTNFGVAKALFITNENLFKYTLITSIIGASSNIVLNYYLIPLFGTKGSLIATILSFTISIFVIDIFYKRMNSNLKLMLLSITTFWKYKIINRL